MNEAEIRQRHRDGMDYVAQGFLALNEMADMLESVNIPEEEDYKELLECVGKVEQWFRVHLNLDHADVARLISKAVEVNSEVAAAERAAGWDPTP